MHEHAMRYALITPAWNEEAHLDQLIQAVTAQTVLPARWVIVSDGSTDRTDSMARLAAERFSWIHLLRLERAPERHFAGKACAVNAGYASLGAVTFDLVGNLDADITLPPDYYEFLIQKFVEMPDLGVAGTPFVENRENPHAHSYRHGFADLNHVSGACQLFRRECFEQIGGYSPVRQGAIDWIAVTSARMRGWKTRTFLERSSFHHRQMGTADRGPLLARFHQGKKDFLVGGDLLWEILRGAYQMTNAPVVLGGLYLMAGYLTAWVTRQPSPVPHSLREFHRREQKDRLRQVVRDRVSRLASAPRWRSRSHA